MLLDIGPLFIPVSHLDLFPSLEDVSLLIIWLSVMTVDLYPPLAVKYHPRSNFRLRNFPFSLSSDKKEQLGYQAYRNTKAFSWGITAPMEGTPNFFFRV
jgi:hypothetical protein